MSKQKAQQEIADVEMYTLLTCPYCIRARRLFKRKGIKFTEIRVTGRNGMWDELEKRSGRNTVPQIFINGEPLGGYDEIAALDRKGELDQKLGIT